MNPLLDKNKVVIAMSGGVDSSVAAALLKEQGYEVVGMMLKLSDPPPAEQVKHVSCCSLEDVNDARRVADQLQIPFYVINGKSEFKKAVIEPFVQAYLEGRTPNPCALCNDKVKFDFLFQKAFELGAYYIATGHYVQKERNEANGQWRLLKGSDAQKDQSYFLFTLGQEQLEHSLFPVGALSKTEVRELAARYHLKTMQKAESQEICFVPDGNHGAFIEKYLQNQVDKSGIMVDAQGKTLAEHEGIHHYTVGQRRGTRVSGSERLYIKSIDADTKTVTMAPNAELYKNSLLARGARWVRLPELGEKLIARLRYRHQGAEAQVELKDAGEIAVHFQEPQRAITPGQAVVFYRGNEMLGGAWIERTL